MFDIELSSELDFEIDPNKVTARSNVWNSFSSVASFLFIPVYFKRTDY